MSVPTYVNIARLCEETCLPERTVETLVDRGELPKPYMKGRHRLWKWKEVEQYIEGREKDRGPRTAGDIANATKAALSEVH